MVVDLGITKGVKKNVVDAQKKEVIYNVEGNNL